ncbi:MAG: TIGR03118 family protein [Armatimonadetes bacterium]|nr:TIGR03118 family protein [Armatimonadota bacterium]
MRNSYRAFVCPLAILASAQVWATQYTQVNLVSDQAGHALNLDPDLVNPWGLAISPTGPMWSANNGTGTATLYNTNGTKQGLVVSIPGTGAATGQVFNGGGGFNVTEGGKSGTSLFMFASEDGTISGWAPSVAATHAVTAVDLSTANASFKGLGIGGGKLFAADFANGQVDMFDSSFNLTGHFTDPNLPTDYNPFNAQVFGGALYVTFALRASNGDNVNGAGLGYLDKFDLNGNFISRLVSQGPLNSAWGMAMAPGNFGEFSNDLLVGNFGDGMINAFDSNTGAFKGSITTQSGTFSEPGLWGLQFGNGITGSTNTLYFAAGVNDEANGLYGRLDVVPEPASMIALGGLCIAALKRRKKA